MVALVDGARAWAAPRGRGSCPDCRRPVLAKCGPIVAWHWAHLPGEPCPFEHEPETEWHRAWKSLFPLELVERHVGGRRVDVLLRDRTAVEFQHSGISAAEIRRREQATGRMLWVFDVRDAAAEERLELRHQDGRGDGYRTFRWRHPRKTVAACVRRVLLDLGPGPVGEAPLLSLGRIYPDAPCGGYGSLVDPAQLFGASYRCSHEGSMQ
jgi:hypothetical protein